MTDKPKLAIINLTGCTGCVISFLDLHEELLDILSKVDLVYATTILDVKEIPKCDIALVDGTVCNTHDVKLAKEIREKAKQVVAIGSCACFGGISGMRNFYGKDATLDYIYNQIPTNDDSKTIPNQVPPLLDSVQMLSEIIKVDFKIPGCPPIPEMIKYVLTCLLEGKIPEVPTRNLCVECNRKKVKMLNPTKEFLTFQVHHLSQIDYQNDLCFLEQGIMCMGFATREGCKGRCVNTNVPCRGCMGVLENERDQGCAAISGLASIFPIGQMMKKEDLAGMIYRYTLPSSMLRNMDQNKGRK
jgi:F420-non-reducing hydrogenase small subunit